MGEAHTQGKSKSVIDRYGKGDSRSLRRSGRARTVRARAVVACASLRQ